MKQITDAQIKAIIDSFYDINAPVKLYEGVTKMLQTLPEIPKVEEKIEETLDK